MTYVVWLIWVCHCHPQAVGIFCHAFWGVQEMDSVNLQLLLYFYVLTFQILSGAWHRICVLPYFTHVPSTYFIFFFLSKILINIVTQRQWTTMLNYSLHYFYLYHGQKLSEKAMATHSRTLAWKIPCLEEPGRLQSMGSPRVGQDWVTLLWLFTFMHWRKKWQPTPIFLPGESQGQRSLVGCRL